jgi:hypothetical protein
MNNAAGQREHRNYSLTTLSIAFCVVALSAGLFVLPDLQYPAVGAAPLLPAPAQPAQASSDMAPSALGSPEENLSDTDRELLAFRPHGG